MLWWLPRYGGGIDALRLLAFGALLLSAATLPGYWLLGSGRTWTLFARLGGVRRAHRDDGVRCRRARSASRPRWRGRRASATAAFAITLVALAARDLRSGPVERLTFAIASFLPAAWAGAAAFAVCAVGPPSSAGAAWLRTAAVALVYAPVLWWFARGLGIGALARAWAAGGARA